MSVRAALLGCVALASSVVDAQEALSNEQRIARLDATLGQFRRLGELAKQEPEKIHRDMRGVAMVDDLGHWAFTPDVIARASALADEVRNAAPGQDLAALDEADALMYPAVARAAEIADYWSLVPRISWGVRWRAFASANGLDAERLDPDIEFEQRQLIEALDAGAFRAAARRARWLDEAFDAAVRTATTNLVNSRKAQDIGYVARSAPCPADGAAASGTAPVRMLKPADPDAFFPPASRERGEQGTIVVRARIAANGCATAFGVLVPSGYPDLDAAALKVAEASRYEAAVEAGKPLAGEIQFKVRFVFKNE